MAILQVFTNLASAVPLHPTTETTKGELMTNRNYWLDLFTVSTWNEFKDKGASVSGFRESRWNSVQQIKPGDYFLCYLTGISRFIGVLEVIDKPYKDSSPIWTLGDFPCRLKVKVVAELEPDTAVPVLELREKLSFFENLASPHAWTGRFRELNSIFGTGIGRICRIGLIRHVRF